MIWKLTLKKPFGKTLVKNEYFLFLSWKYIYIYMYYIYIYMYIYVKEATEMTEIFEKQNICFK